MIGFINSHVRVVGYEEEDQIKNIFSVCWVYYWYNNNSNNIGINWSFKITNYGNTRHKN
jgi:hypothetical protein